MSFEKIGFVNYNESYKYNFFTNHFNQDYNFYRLKTVDSNNNISYSNIIKFVKNQVISRLTISPNPVVHYLTFNYNALEDDEIICKIYTEDGRAVKQFTQNIYKGNNNITAEVSALLNGFYFLVLSKPNMRIAEGSFIKK